MTIKQKNNESNGAFYAIDNGNEIGKMSYVWAGIDKMIIDHTNVIPPHEGRGIGTQMVNASVEYARQNSVKILPLCPFAKNVFLKNSEYLDVMAK